MIPTSQLDPLELDLELASELEVERPERLVEQQDRRLADERPGERDALLLAARELVRGSSVEAGEVDELERGADTPPGIAVRDLAPAQAEGHVVEDREMREERVALEDHVDRPALGRIHRDVPPAELDPAARR